MVELVDLANRTGEVSDSHLPDQRDAQRLRGARRGGNAERKDGSTRPVEYWTLRKSPAGEWIVSSVEQAAEGAHHLTGAVETDGWDQKAVAREAVLEVAGKTSVPGAGDILSLTNPVVER